jgi:hypothetical protein
MEPTNHVAERALRRAVPWRKGSFGSSSGRGLRFVERILTIGETCAPGTPRTLTQIAAKDPVMARIPRWVYLALGVMLLGWCVYDRDRTAWETSVPDQFVGRWDRVESSDLHTEGVEAFIFQPSTITKVSIDAEGLTRRDSYPVRRVSITTRSDDAAGRAVIFYGKPEPSQVAEHRLQVFFGKKGLITVQDIVPTGVNGGDAWFDVGRFRRASASVR